MRGSASGGSPRGGSVEDYRAPLFIAWQLTNRCRGACLHCCEESGPERAWPNELSREEAVSVARQIVELRVAEAAFGGGEPLAVAHFWDVVEVLSAGEVALKIETDGLRIDDAAADQLARLEVECVQISMDGASAATHERVRPGGNFRCALAAVTRLRERGLAPDVVFVPTRLNASEAPLALEVAARAGAARFVTGPLMRLGRAAASWDALALDREEWAGVADALRERAERLRGVELVVYPHDIVAEIAVRVESPQAMMLIVPDGKVKLLNALPFVCADLRRDSLAEAWRLYGLAWKEPLVRSFAARVVDNEAALLLHANETWSVHS